MNSFDESPVYKLKYIFVTKTALEKTIYIEARELDSHGCSSTLEEQKPTRETLQDESNHIFFLVVIKSKIDGCTSSGPGRLGVASKYFLSSLRCHCPF
ncbi:hypothetical protein L3Y34_010984 [Caenorhabditis briggsae]|uniref:Uncharacterized protein n=1 Tax=Caenorhabditis briggsae TaxID=6238 RepID=A0AAE9CTW3_CAEBR|nr:hypothetical protein L3Y34_010984 [Caenorhabditis briggsae]